MIGNKMVDITLKQRQKLRAETGYTMFLINIKFPKTGWRKKQRKRSVRGFAILLCLALCLENASLTALAAEPGVAEAAFLTETETVSGGDVLSEENVEPAGDAPTGDEEGDGQSQEPGEVETDVPTEGTEVPPEESTELGDEVPAEGNEEPEQVSENSLDTISENTLETISENSLDVEWQTLVKEAEEAFDALLSEKPLMALLYHTDRYAVRKQADENSASVATLEIGQTLYVKGVTITEDDVWYCVQYWLDGAEGTGYVQSYYLAYSDEDWIAWEEEYLFPILGMDDAEYGVSAYGMTTYSMMTYAVNNTDIAAFPGSYQNDLRSLKNAHPNWTFVPMKTGLDFNASVSGEMGDKSLIQKTTANSSKGWVGNACPSESGWYYATRPAVAYYMDPRNFLTETYIFQFEQLTFNSSYHTESAVQTFLNSTFMKGKLADDAAGRTYARAFYEIGKSRKLSPTHLASRVYQEQGQGTSGLISGTYSGYEGYYNFFNVGVSGSSTAEKIVKGLTYAKSKGWNTRYKSLEGGAATIGNNYILKYQDTIYLEKFNVDKNSPYGVYAHQYMQNIQAPASESSSTKKIYTNAGSLNGTFVFKIPVYNNMPDEVYYPALKLNATNLTLNRALRHENEDKEPDAPTTYQLKLYADNVELEPSNAKWESSNNSVATVTDGLITVVDQGEATITASFMDVEVVCKVTVKVPLESLSLDKTELRLRRPDTVVKDTAGMNADEKAGNTDMASLQVSFHPGDTTADRTITWASSNGKIATVKADPADSSRAVVTAVSTGKVTITAKASKAGNKTAKCEVYVSAPIYQLALTNPNAKDTDTEQSTTLLAGQNVNLAAEYWPKDTTSDTQVTWISSNPNVATVKNGKVEAVGKDARANKTVITAKVTVGGKDYTATHEIAVERCTVTFMKPNGKTLKEQSVPYGSSLPEQDFPQAETVAGSLFIGWYTGVNGTGSRFDETTVIHQKDTKLYPYYQEQGKGFYVLPVGDQVYTGSAIKPTVQVYDSVACENGDSDLIDLVLNRDYTVSYQNNKNVNLEGKAVPTVTVRGKGNYTGMKQVTFNIVPKALTDTDITADDITVAYSGRVIKSVPTVYRNGKKLVRNTDYTLTYPQAGTGAYQTAGVHPIVIMGKGGYTGKITVYETITADVLLSKVSVAGIPKQTYSNEQMAEKGGIRPDALNVTYKKQPLAEGVHYTVAYSADQSIGKATATLTAVEGSGYAGSRSVTYQIVGTPITKAKVEGIVNKEYTGKESDVQQSGYALTIGEKVLVESKDGGETGDYMVSYLKTDKVGTATIVFQGIHEYSGQLKRTYRILPYEFTPEQVGDGQDITLSYCTQDAPEKVISLPDIDGIATPYVKGGSKPTVLISFRGQLLTLGKDYTISYRNNNALTTADMMANRLPAFTVTGKGNFKGKLTGNFTVTDGRMSDKVTMTLKDVVYREKKAAYKTQVILRDVNGAALSAGRDYDRNLQYTYEADTEVKIFKGEPVLRKAGETVGEEDIPQVGAAIRVTAQGMGAYQGADDAECSAVYRIVAADLAKARVKVGAKSYLNGREVLLTAEDLTLTISGAAEPLCLGEDYIIEDKTYVNHTKKGTARVTLRGIGNYGGEKTISYTIGAKALWW